MKYSTQLNDTDDTVSDISLGIYCTVTSDRHSSLRLDNSDFVTAMKAGNGLLFV